MHRQQSMAPEEQVQSNGPGGTNRSLWKEKKDDALEGTRTAGAADSDVAGAARTANTVSGGHVHAAAVALVGHARKADVPGLAPVRAPVGI